MTRIALNIATIFATLTGLALLWEFRGAALIFCISLALAAAMRPAIEFFVARKFPVTVGVAATYLPLLGLLGLLIFLSVSRMGDEFNRMVQDADGAYKQINEKWRNGNLFERAVAQLIPPIVEKQNSSSVNKTTETSALAAGLKTPEKSHLVPLAGTKLTSNGVWDMVFLETLLGLTLSVAGVLFDTLLIIVLSIYWSLDRIHFERLWLSLLSTATRSPARHIWRAIETEIGRYLRSEFLQSLLAGLLLAVGYWSIGCHYPILLALLGAAAWLIPWIGVLFAVLGVTISSLPSLIAESGMHSYLVLGGAILYTCAVLLVLEILVEPRLFNRRRYSTVLTAFVAVSLAMVWGVFGLLVGPPLAVVLQVFGSYLFRRRLGLSDQPVPSPAELAARLAALRATMAESSEPRPELSSMLDRLAALTDKVRQELGASGSIGAGQGRLNRTGSAGIEAARS